MPYNDDSRLVGGAPMTAIEKAPTEVESEVQQLRGAMEELHQVLQSLEARLQTVLRTPPEQPNKTSEPKLTVQLVPLAMELREHNRIIASATMQLRSIKDRIEL